MKRIVMAVVAVGVLGVGCSSSSDGGTSSGSTTSTSTGSSGGNASGSAASGSSGSATNGSGSTGNGSTSSSASSSAGASTGGSSGSSIGGSGEIDVTVGSDSYALTYQPLAHRQSGATWTIGASDNDHSGGHGLAITLIHPLGDGGYGVPVPGTYDCADDTPEAAGNGGGAVFSDAFGGRLLAADDIQGACTIVVTRYDEGGRVEGTFSGHLANAYTHDGGEDFSGTFDAQSLFDDGGQN